jgi:hypothetical protein
MRTYTDKDGKVTVRASEFRYIPADYVNIAMGEDGIKMILGVEEVNGEATELTGIQMSLKTAYGIMVVLRDAMEHAENEFGVNFEEPKVVDSDI